MADPHAHCHAHSHDHTHADPSKVVDPVCGMTVDPAKTAHQAEHDGQGFHFCSAGCRTKFIADPTRYLEKDTRPPEPAPPAGLAA